MLRRWKSLGYQIDSQRGHSNHGSWWSRPWSLIWALKSCTYPWCLKLTLSSSTTCLVSSCPNAQASSLLQLYVHACGSFFSSLHQCLLSLRTNKTQYFVLALKCLMCHSGLYSNLTLISETMKPDFSLLISCTESNEWNNEWNISGVTELHHCWGRGGAVSC